MWVIFHLLSGGALLAAGNMVNLLNYLFVVGMLATGMTFVMAAGHIDLSVGSGLGPVVFREQRKGGGIKRATEAGGWRTPWKRPLASNISSPIGNARIPGRGRGKALRNYSRSRSTWAAWAMAPWVSPRFGGLSSTTICRGWV